MIDIKELLYAKKNLKEVKYTSEQCPWSYSLHNFINDLPNYISTKCKIFADDTKIYSSSTNNSIIQKDLDELQKLSEKRQLPFNTDKCKCMYYGKNNPGIVTT